MEMHDDGTDLRAIAATTPHAALRPAKTDEAR